MRTDKKTGEISPDSGMRMRTMTHNKKTGEVTYGPWEDVPTHPIPPEQF